MPIPGAQTPQRDRAPNQTTEEQEQQILEMIRRFPSYYYPRISAQLQLEGKAIGINAVGVWLQHRLQKKLDRFLWLDRQVNEGRAILTEDAARALRKLKRPGEATEQHIEANFPGDLISQDLYFVGTV